MHSSLISKIRILKPRKKTTQNPKSFTIKKLNFNTSSKLQISNANEESPPPPLIHKNILDDDSIKKSTNDQSQKWLPVYIVNVPKKGVEKVSKIDSENVIKINGSGSSGKTIKCSNDELASDSDVMNNKNMSGSTFVYSNIEKSKKPLISESICIIPSKSKRQGINAGDIKEASDRSCIQKDDESVKSKKPVSCFLCTLSFETVSEMQSHYLDSHKQKKRSTAANDNANRSASFPAKYKLIKSKDIFDGINIDAGEGEPKCPICSIDFKTEEEVKDHMTSVHCYKCSECQNTFYTLFQFTDHRCNQGNKMKKTRLKKKKFKVKLPQPRDKDPLALSPKLSTVPNTARTISVLDNNTADHNLSSQPTSVTINPQINLHQSSVLNNSPEKINFSAVGAGSIHDGNFINLGHTNKSTNDGSLQRGSSKILNKSKSLLDYSLEELTSKEFNRMKLTEIMQNPNLSVKLVKNTECSEKVIGEFFSCGRCNVLCEDKNDFTDHLEECLRLSNVSLISSQGPPKRIIKLKSETVCKKICNDTKTSINQKLLTQLKNYIDLNNTDLLHSSENIDDCFSIPKEKHNEKYKSHNEFFHPDIKGNISIRKIDKSGTKINLPKSALSGIYSCKQPMVVIPICKSFEANIIKSAEVENTSYSLKQKYSDTKSEDHYPEISIIDKSNCVTYKFTGFGTDPELKYDASLQPSEFTSFREKGNISARNVVKFNTKTRALEKASPFMTKSHSHDKEDLTAIEIKDSLVEQSLLLKTEPSTSLQSHIKVICNPDSDEYEPIEEKYSSLELILDEEEIKMEVEDEIVDDCF